MEYKLVCDYPYKGFVRVFNQLFMEGYMVMEIPLLDLQKLQRQNVFPDFQDATPRDRMKLKCLTMNEWPTGFPILSSRGLNVFMDIPGPKYLWKLLLEYERVGLPIPTKIPMDYVPYDPWGKKCLHMT